MKIKNYRKVIFCLFVSLQAGSFAFTAKNNNASMPEWVSEPASVYPNAQYLHSVGDGSDRNKAEAQAINGLAAIFGQSIKSESKASQRMEQAKNEGRVATTNVSSFNQEVLRSVNIDDLIGVEMKGYWFDGDKTWYAIAVLEKSKATDIYVDMIKKNDRAIKELLERSEGDVNSLDAYASYDFACDIARENENHAKKLAVINPSVVSIIKAHVPSSKEINARKMDVAKNIPFCVVIDGDESGRIAAAFTDVIASYGFRGTLDATGRYLLTGKLDFEESVSSDKKTTRCRFALKSYILDSETEQKICPFNTSGREGHVSYSEAKNRAAKSVEKKIKSDFSKAFGEFLKSL